LHGVGTTRTDKFDKKSAQKGQINNPKMLTLPGCDRPATWTSGHHLKHWFHGGTNEPDNLTLLCYRHHWMVHEGGWQIAWRDDGRLVTIPPTVTFAPSPRGPD